MKDGSNRLASPMARRMCGIAIVSGIATLLFALPAAPHGREPWLTLAISCGVTCYHFSYRLLVGLLLDARLHNQLDPEAWLFRPRRGEAQLYRMLRVQRWKHRLPTFAPGTFSLRQHSCRQIAAATCQSELVHLLNIPLSFAPLLLIPRFGSAAVFFITSLLAAAFDAVFIIIQRYNRPRLLHLAARQEQINHKERP